MATSPSWSKSLDCSTTLPLVLLSLYFTPCLTIYYLHVNHPTFWFECQALTAYRELKFNVPTSLSDNKCHLAACCIQIYFTRVCSYSGQKGVIEMSVVLAKLFVCLFCSLFCQLTHIRIFWKEGISIEKMPALIKMACGRFLDWHGKAGPVVGSPTLGQVVLGCIKK